MRILVTIPYFYPALSYGGPAKVVYDLCLELAKNNQVTVCTSDAWDEHRRMRKKERITSSKNLSVKYFPNAINRFAYTQRFFTSFGMVGWYLKNKNEYDVLHQNDIFSLPQIMIGYIAVLFHKKYVISPHGVLDPVRMKQKSIMKKIFYLVLVKKLLFSANAVVATSEGEKKVLEKYGFNNVVCVYNGIPLSTEKPSSKFNRFNKRIFTIIYIGKLHLLKGLRQFIKALSKLGLDVQLLIAGPDDGARKGIEEEISLNHVPNVHFLGYVNENEKEELYSYADLFIHPSLSEGFSISILEALRAGVPVLITEACNFSDVQKYGAGIVISNRNLVKNLVKSLNYLYNNPAALRKMSGKARILVRDKYSIKKMAQKILGIYRS